MVGDVKKVSVVEEIEVGKQHFERLIKCCSEELEISEPVINWGVEYYGSKTRYIAFLFFKTTHERFHLDSLELSSLITDSSRKEDLAQKIKMAFEKFDKSSL